MSVALPWSEIEAEAPKEEEEEKVCAIDTCSSIRGTAEDLVRCIEDFWSRSDS